ncbi:MAG TPA: prepilin-type N-terminal cleavage/methylation domain-containing protein [Candidatus Acidoferrum sp.]|nr:prepilin-type N-terminal cleavage/methylation domain-containing protein [Candidatus Acidoferrum sp.]
MATNMLLYGVSLVCTRIGWAVQGTFDTLSILVSLRQGTIEVNMIGPCKTGRKARGNAARGFSLIELLVVVAIILIIAAIAIPNFLRAKLQANESAAVASIHAINTAEIAYSSACPSIGFSATLLELNTSTTCVGGSGQIDSSLASGTKGGYVYTYLAGSGSPAPTYALNVDPLNRGVTGQRSFFSSEVSVTHVNQNASASANDNAIQ